MDEWASQRQDIGGVPTTDGSQELLSGYGLDAHYNTESKPCLRESCYLFVLLTSVFKLLSQFTYLQSVYVPYHQYILVCVYI